MIFHENCLLADNSHEISYPIFFQKLGNMSENVSSAAVVTGALRINSVHIMHVSIHVYRISLKAFAFINPFMTEKGTILHREDPDEMSHKAAFHRRLCQLK